MSTPLSNHAFYDEQAAKQIEQYKETEIMHDLPRIYEYWSKKHFADKAAKVAGFSTTIDFYAGYFEKALTESTSNILLSIGAGDCSIEIEIVKKLLAKNVKPFSFVCLELSPILVANARRGIEQGNLNDVISVLETDINNWQPQAPFAGAMAHHSLHHILNLEHLFAVIKQNLSPNGLFLTCDIIGRNGHMRWPESLILTRKIWERLPRKYKYHHRLNKTDDYFDNWDCSNEGFEGIRAQDILPLLIQLFSFEVFFSYGNLTDVFLDRGFGPNYDSSNPLDAAFVDYLHETNEQLIDKGILKPTYIIGVLRNEPVTPVVYKHWTPEFAVRNPEAIASGYNVDAYLTGIPYPVASEDNPLTARSVGNYRIGEKLVFGKEHPSRGTQFLKFGWGLPEENLTWSSCEDAAIMFPLDQPLSQRATLQLEFIPYQSPLYTQTAVDIHINDIFVKSLIYDNGHPAGCINCSIEVPPEALVLHREVDVTFVFPNRRMPQYEGGDDVRSLGIALVSAGLYLAGR